MQGRKGTPNRGKQIPGNTIEEARLYQQDELKTMTALRAMEQAFVQAMPGELDLRRLSIKPCDLGYEEWLLVCSVTIDGLEKVAFHRDSGLIGTLRGFANRIRNGSLRFKEDVPYGEQS